MAREFTFAAVSGAASYDLQAFTRVATPPVINAGADVLLIQDYDAWGYPAITTILNNNAIPYELINSSQIAGWDFAPYKMIIIPSVQDSIYYNNFNNNLAKIEDFIDGGGFVLMSLLHPG